LNILLDECVDWRFGRLLSNHDVSAVFREGWSGTRNGTLLTLAAAKFDVLLTVDQNLSYQQSIEGLEIAIVVIESHGTRLQDLEPFAANVLSALKQTRMGQVIRSFV
jgi:hypothetical protein